MKTNRWNWKPRTERAGEAGQSMVFIVLVLGTFLFGALCFAFDLSNMWFHRQAAQSAADAACAAGAMDILVDDTTGVTNKGGFTPTAGTSYACATAPTDSVCNYAALNGYTGNVVNVSFPAAAPPGVTAAPSVLAPYSFIRVDVVDHVQTFFAGMLNGSRTADVRAFSTCGVEEATAPIPLIVLDPRAADGITLKTFGTAGVAIYGGPQQSIEVNSNASPAVQIQGNADIDLSQGGPSATGSNLGVFGGPASAPGGFVPGSTGTWISPSSPINDPFAQIPAPAMPMAAGVITTAAGGTAGNLGVDGCPEQAPTTCDEYLPGYYTSANGITVKNRTAIFQPGIYWVQNGFTAGPNSCIRPSTAVGDGSGGTMFYFADAYSINVGSNSGNKCPALPNTYFNTTSGSGSLLTGAKCTAASTIPSNLPATLTGTVLLGPCQAPTVSTLCAPNCSLNYGDPMGTLDPLGEQRGFLFFQDRAIAASTAPGNLSWQGGGNFLLSGTMYFHQCVTSGSDTGVGCNSGVGGAYNDVLSLGGGSGSGTYVLGQVVTDQAILGGNSALTMDLNPTTVYSILKASIFQ